MLLEISKQLGLPVKKVMDMLWALKSSQIENNDLVRRVGISRNVINQVKEGLENLLEPVSGKTALNDQGRNVVGELFLGSYETEESMWAFLERNNQFGKVVNLLKGYKNLRAEPKRDYDQFTATIETTTRRAILMDFFEDIKGKRILFLGDDDFTSVAVSHVGKPARVCVLDIDPRILEGIKIASAGIETTKYDARKVLPDELRGKFDVVFTDPPYTTEGVSLFLSRAIEALDINGNQAARIYFCYGNSDRAKERFLPIYGVVIKSGLMMRWVFDKFNRYTGAESIGSASSLFICDITPKTKVLIHGTYSENIYTTKNSV